MGCTWTVEFKDDPTNQDYYGNCDHDKQLITLHRKVNGADIHPEKIEDCFLHELTRAILEHLHQRELNENEDFVTQFAGLLHQFIKTHDGQI